MLLLRKKSAFPIIDFYTETSSSEKNIILNTLFFKPRHFGIFFSLSIAHQEEVQLVSIVCAAFNSIGLEEAISTKNSREPKSQWHDNECGWTLMTVEKRDRR